MECKHDWTFVDGLTKRIRCTRCADMKFVDGKDKYVVEGFKFHDPRPNSIVFYNGGNPISENEVMRLSAEGVKVNPKFTVDEATGYVLKALDGYLKAMAQKEYERGVIDGKAQRPPSSWAGLTQEEVEKYDEWEDFQVGCGRGTLFAMIRDIEAKLKGRNT